MTTLPGIVVTGASGRMGQMLVRLISASDKARLVGCVERAGHAWVGQDIGTCMGGAALGVRVTDDPLEAFAQAQAVVDFTSPAKTTCPVVTKVSQATFELGSAAKKWSINASEI